MGLSVSYQNLAFPSKVKPKFIMFDIMWKSMSSHPVICSYKNKPLDLHLVCYKNLDQNITSSVLNLALSLSLYLMLCLVDLVVHLVKLQVHRLPLEECEVPLEGLRGTLGITGGTEGAAGGDWAYTWGYLLWNIRISLFVLNMTQNQHLLTQIRLPNLKVWGMGSYC